jgi:hypothetical protein
VLELNVPTAVHAVPDEQDTAANELPELPVGAGVALTDHFVPFQVSPKVPVNVVLML